jgi:hypothetical protein
VAHISGLSAMTSVPRVDHGSAGNGLNVSEMDGALAASTDFAKNSRTGDSR